MRTRLPLALLLLLPAPTLAQEAPKAALAWNLAWDVDWVTAVSFVGPNRVVAGNNLGDLLVWDLPDDAKAPAPKPARRLTGHTNVITRLLPMPDGRRFISASNDHTIRIWDLDAPTGGEDTLVLNARPIREAAERKRGKAPAAVEVKVAVQQSERVLTGHKDWVLGLGLSQDARTLISGDDKGEVIVWDLPDGKERRRWKVKGWVYALALAPDASTALVSERLPLVFDGGRHTGMKLWDVSKGEVKHDLSKAFKEMMATAAFSPDGKVLAVARGGEADGPNGKVTLLDPTDGKKVRELTPGHLYGATDLAFSPDGTHLYSAGRDTVVRVWAVADGKLVQTLGQPRGGQFKDWIHAVAVSPDGRRLAAADMAGQVQVWMLDGK
jgi:WD40 repeat protein